MSLVSPFLGHCVHNTAGKLHVPIVLLANCYVFLPCSAMLAWYMLLSCAICLLHASIVSKWLNTIIETTPHDSQGTQVFWYQRLGEIRTDSPPTGAPTAGEGRLKYATFDK